MVYRKGELSSHGIDREWPYQVALPESVTVGKANVVAREFCKDLSLAPRGHTFVRGGEYIKVWCFAVKADAEKFQARFGGEMIDPKNRPKWPG